MFFILLSGVAFSWRGVSLWLSWVLMVTAGYGKVRSRMLFVLNDRKMRSGNNLNPS